MAEPVSSETRALLTLKLISGLGPRLTSNLLARFGTAEATLVANAPDLESVPGIGTKSAQLIANARNRINVDDEIQKLQANHTRLLIRNQPGYPESLNPLDDSPHLLYLKGTYRPEDQKAVAIVGSRTCTSYGRKITAKLAMDLVRHGYVVVSGLARGIDGVAHKAALEAGGRTIAVLASGLARIYPPEHKPLAAEIVQAGALVSENCMLQEPLAGTFPARNRIISGLSKAVVVVEAPKKSGALITATHAADQGRTVLAVPGSVESQSSEGTHELIRKGAVLCRGIEDVLEELNLFAPRPVQERASPSESAPAPKPAPPPPPPPQMDENQKRIWDLLADGALNADQMVQRLNVPIQQLTVQLTMMELKKMIRRGHGNTYERS